MGTPYSRAPHVGGPGAPAEAPHAALLIDFDNVTMGMRSDLSRELKNLLSSDVIKGKVSVQRAYADWRRYPQYIVPLSEASVDLIFAPAYGSNKKNATDIRMAIDAVELVFIRPEIGTYILLTGDSDFSSLVLKLKEYGKYVIGVGIQESSSDILVQNCDEYYSYTSLTGLRKTTETDHKPADPWVLLSEALKKMDARGDVMRSDRLKQVMQELDPGFDEGGVGFSKFSRFLAEGSSRGLVQLRKMENGQYEVSLPKGKGRGRSDSSGSGGRRDRRRDRPRRNGDGAASSVTSEADASEDAASAADPLQAAYELVRRALGELKEAGRDPVRDSDLKRKLLEMNPNFDEAELGFPKFSRFLQQAEDHEVVTLTRNERGNVEVSLFEAGASGGDQGRSRRGRRGGREGHGRAERAPQASSGEGRADATDGEAAPVAEPAADDSVSEAGGAAVEASEAPGGTGGRDAGGESGDRVVEIDPQELGPGMLHLGARRGTTRRRGEGGPVLFEGQVVAPSTSGAEAAGKTGPSAGRSSQGEAGEARDGSDSPAVGASRAEAATGPSQAATLTSEPFDASALGLPTDARAVVRYMAHRYKGVGEKTAETLVEVFGSDVFRTLRDDPEAVLRAVPGKRGEQVLEAWQVDYARRRGQGQGR